MSVFNTDNKTSHLTAPMFFGESVDLARYDKVKYPAFDKLTEKQLGFFWRPEEINLSRDQKDFKLLTEHERHMFTSNLKRQILLDSVQGRAPTLAFGPIVSLPELETWIQTWAFSETIHSRSYTHIIRNVYSDPSVVFDTIRDIPEILDCARDISKYYDSLIAINNDLGWCDPYYNTMLNYDNPEYEHKKALWLCLNAVNALEGIRFYVSFAVSWNFAEQKKMAGNAAIIKLIARDENIHLASTQQMLKLLPKEDPIYAEIAKDCEAEVRSMWESIASQEKAWAEYLFKDGSVIGLNEKLLCDYVEWITNKRMTAIGLEGLFKTGSNPLPWTQKWIAGSDVQPAPQEKEITSYVGGGVKQDVSETTFKGFSL